MKAQLSGMAKWATKLTKKSFLVMTVAAATLPAMALPGLVSRVDAATAPVVVSLTFDNAWANQMTAADDMAATSPPLQGTFYVPSGWIGLNSNYMTLANLQTLAANGDEIGGKTVSNADLMALTQSGTTSGTDEAEREVCEGRNALLADGFDVTDFAYPFSDFSTSADEAIVQECGFNSARAVGGLADEQPGGCTAGDCPDAETLPVPSTDLYNIPTPDDTEVNSTVAELEGDVTNAVNNGGGWLAFSWHQICDTSTDASCDPRYSWSPDNFEAFVQWLAGQETSTSGTSGAITVETVQQVIGGSEQPAVTNYPVPSTAPVGTNALANSNLTNGLTVTGSPNPAPTSGNVTYNVTVAEGGTTPTGSVTVSDGDTGSCTIATLTNGTGSCSIDESAAPTAYTVTATYSGDSTYPGTEPTLTGTTNETVGQSTPIIAAGSASPTCWTPNSFGSNSPTFSWSTTGGYGGGGEDTLTMADTSTGNADLISRFDVGQCAPTAVAGDSYSLSVYYKSTVPVFFTVYGESSAAASAGTWSYWTNSETFPASPNGWALATWLTPPVPSTIAALSYGLTIASDGTLSTSDYSLVNTGLAAPPPAPTGVNALQNPLLETADASGVNPVCWSPDSDETTTPTFTWSPTGGEVGGEETIDQTSFDPTNPYADAALLSTFDNGNCSPTVVAGDTYSISVFYESTQPVLLILYGRTNGTWGYLDVPGYFPAASGWALATATYTVPSGSGVNALSFGMAIEQVGTLSTSDYSLVNTGADVPTVTVTGSPSPATTGPVTYNVTVSGSGATPTGSVTVSDGAGGNCTTALTSGAGSCSITEAAGTYSVTANYSGDANFATATGTTSETVNKATPTLVVAGPSGATTGPVSYTVSFTGATLTPTGSVTVSDGTNPSCTATLSGGSGSCSITENAGPYTLTATYNGDTNYNATTVTTTVTVAQATPTVTVNGPATAPAPGSAVLYTLTVSGLGTAAPSGTVTVSDGTNTSTGTCTAALSTGTGATSTGGCSITEAAGTYTVTATYSGDPNYAKAVGMTTETIAKATPTLTVTGAAGATTGPVSYSVTLSGSGATPTGSVTVSDGTNNGTNSCIVTLSGGAGSCSITENAASSPYSVSASYVGDNNYNGTTTTTTETVAQATPTVTVNGPATAPLPGSPVLYTVAVSGLGATPTGSVTVSDGTNPSCTASLTSGADSCSITENAGSYTVTAAYGGDPNYNSASVTTTETVPKATASMTLNASPDPQSPPGQVTYTVAITGVSGVPLTGMVTVSDGNGGSCTISTVTSGTGSCPITEAAGTYTVTATYSNSNYNASPATTTETVNLATPTVTVSGAAGASSGPVNYSVTVTGEDGIPPGGTVTVSDGTNSSTGNCTASLNAGTGATSSGSCSIPEGAGSYTVTASYNGDTNYAMATGTTSETVGNATPTLAVTGATGATTGPVSYIVTVTGGTGVTPTGSVTVSDGPTDPSCTATLSGGTGGCSITENAGPYTVTATYGGDSNYGGATAKTTETVGKATPTVIVNGPATAPTPGAAVSYTVAVSGLGAAPTGTVSVSDGTRKCSITLGATAGGSCSLTEPAGTYTITATYAGNTNYNTASGTTSEAVAKATPTVKVTGSPNPATAPGSVTYAATVTGTGPTPTGTVRVSDGTRACSITLSSTGAGSCSISEPSGTYTMTATYNGNTSYNTATSTTSETVGKATPTVTVAGSPNPRTSPGPVTYAVTVTGVTGFTPTGSVTVSDGTKTCTKALSAGGCSISEPAGTYTVTATYAGNTNYNTAMATTSETVDVTTPTVTVTAANNPRTSPGSVTYRATVTGVTGFIPTGSVAISDGDGHSCVISALGTGGGGTCAISEPAGTYTVTASYAGNSNYNTASGTMTETVDKTTSKVKITGSPNPATAAGLITYTVTVTGVAAFTPTGTVSVSDGAGGSCSVLLSAGTGTCAITEAVATYTATASYSGDSNYDTSSGTVTERVR